MVKTTIKKRLVNPHRRTKAKPRTKKNSGHRRAKRTAQKRNPGQLLTLGFLNPQKRRTMKKSRKKHARRAVAKKANPFKFRTRAKKSFRRRRNPSAAGIVGKSTNFIKTGLLVLIGLVITRQLPQLVLKEKNSGWMGYLSNAVAAVLASTVVSKTMGKDKGQLIAIGGAAYLCNRVLTEKFSPIGQMLSLSGVGDYAATGSLGRVVPQYAPAAYSVRGGTPTYNPNLLAAAVPPAPQKSMGAFGRAWAQ